jgi:UDPglucose 6-dehydrogenase
MSLEQQALRKLDKATTMYGNTMKKITVIGCGYVGLVTAACLSEVGHNVTNLDIDEKKIQALLQGVIPIYEEGLEELVKRNRVSGRLSFTTSYTEALKDSQLVIIAVDTPPLEDGSCDLKNLKKVAHTLGEMMEHDLGVVIKSTVPVGSAALVSSIISACLERRSQNLWFEVISNPEFLREGNAISDFMHPDRVIIGLTSERAEELMRTLYQPFITKLIFMDTASSELTKYAANTMLALRITFMNNLSSLCEKTGADIESIKRGIGTDPRIGPAFLNAGIGYGGSCFPKDVKALEQMMKQKDLPCELISAIDITNERQKKSLGEKILRYFSETGGASKKTVCVLGLAFKPDTDDMREAPSLQLINLLLEAGVSIQAFDPIAMDSARKLFSSSAAITFCTNEEEAIRGSDAIALVTEWKQFTKIDFTKVLPIMRGNAFFDGRNLFDPEKMKFLGFSYVSIGRPSFSSKEPIKTTCCTSHTMVPA